MAELSVETFDLRLRTPLRASWGELTDRALLKVRVDFGANDYGDGEAAPLEAYDGVSFAAVRAALDAYARVLARASPRSTHAELLAACAAERALPQALAAIDLALWDRAGRRTGFPVAQLIAAGAVGSVAVNATIGAMDRAGAASAAAAAAEAGFRCVKVKVGVGDDAGRDQLRDGKARAAARPVPQRQIDSRERLRQRPFRCARGQQLGVCRARRSTRQHGGVGVQRGDHRGERDAVVELERRRLAHAEIAVAEVEPHAQELALLEHAPRRLERRERAHRDSVDRELGHQLARIPADSRPQNTSWSMPVPASAPLSDGPSVRVRTVRTTGTASGTASSGSSSQADSSPEPSSHGSGALTNAA